MLQSPYWWDAAPLTDSDPTPLPGRADVVVVGAGFTGLSAAHTLARGGRDVVVLDRQRAGEGASSRNLGLMSGALKISFASLMEKTGLSNALALYGESARAREYLKQLIEEEKIECDVLPSGRYTAAVSPRHYETLARQAQLNTKHLDLTSFAVNRAEQNSEVGGDHFHGGVVDEDISSFHPGKYHAGLLASVNASSAAVHPLTEVQSLDRTHDGFEVVTSRGPIATRNVVVATNGYATPGLAWWQRRVVPVAAQILTTEPIGDNLMRRLSPNGRAIIESSFLFHYLRPTPDGKRLLLGGRYGGTPAKAATGMSAIKKHFDQIFPELKGVEITHSWDGFTAFTRDFLPHMGVDNGIHYAMGFCGSGTVWGTWLGHKIALKILGSPQSQTMFDTPAPGIPFYRGKPWFLAPAMGWFAMQDRLQR